MSRPPDVELRLLNTIENLAVVHRVLSGTALALSLSALEADGLITAVEELCKNVVHHAYDGVTGPLELELHVLPGAIEAIVRDEGYGIRPHLGERSLPHTGIGLPMVHSLARRVTYVNRDGGGTAVVMELPAPSTGAPEPRAGAEEGTPAARTLSGEALHSGGASTSRERPDPDPGAIELSLASRRLLEPVLAGVVLELAGRAGVQEPAARELAGIARTLAEGAPEGDSRPLHGLLALSGQALAIRVWPLDPLAAGTLLRRLQDLTAGLGDVLEVGLESTENGQLLAVRVSATG